MFTLHYLFHLFHNTFYVCTIYTEKFLSEQMEDNREWGNQPTQFYLKMAAKSEVVVCVLHVLHVLMKNDMRHTWHV